MSPRPVQPAAQLVAAGLIGAAGFAYTVPLAVLVPTNLGWMLEADRAAQLMGWLFFRNEPWRFPLGTLRTLIAPMETTVGYSDSIPWVAALSKLLFGWISTPFQFSGLWLLGCFVLQGIFGFLLLRALRAPTPLALVGSGFFVTSPVLLERYQHISLCAQWLVLAALWLSVRPPHAEQRWRVALPWIVIAVIAASTYPYLAAMVLAIACASYVRRAAVDRTLAVPAALVQLASILLGVVAAFWVWGYFSFTSGAEEGFGTFSADALAFFNPAHSSSILQPIGGIADSYEGYGYLGFGVLLLVALGLAAVAARRGESAERRCVVCWPLVAATALMFVYAMATPITVAGRPVATVPLYHHLGSIPSTFRASGRFLWPAYYLIMAAAIAALAHAFSSRIASRIALAALIVQLLEIRPLRAEVRASYGRTNPVLRDPAWQGLGRAFRSIRLVPPIVAHRVACAKYGRPDDYAIPFSLLAAREKMRFNSGNLARVDDLRRLCAPMIDSLRRGLIDDSTVYIPDAAFRDSIERWLGSRVVCGGLEEANVCVARHRLSALGHRLSATAKNREQRTESRGPSPLPSPCSFCSLLFALCSLPGREPRAAVFTAGGDQRRARPASCAGRSPPARAGGAR